MKGSKISQTIITNFVFTFLHFLFYLFIFIFLLAYMLFWLSFPYVNVFMYWFCRFPSESCLSCPACWNFLALVVQGLTPPWSRGQCSEGSETVAVVVPVVCVGLGRANSFLNCSQSPPHCPLGANGQIPPPSWWWCWCAVHCCSCDCCPKAQLHLPCRWSQAVKHK